MAARYFAKCVGYEASEFRLPERSTSKSAGYDFFAPEEVVIPSIWKKIVRKILFKEMIIPFTVKTHVKAKMRGNEMLMLCNRSSNPRKLGLVLANGIGVIDADYFGNKDNDGDIGFPFYNFMPWDVKIKKGQKLGQGIFQTYLRTDADAATGEREGGFGSTGE